jgi:single-strand DNA-binding protein
MQDGLNKVFLLGNLGGEPELRHTKSGTAILKLSVATNESYFDKEGTRQSTTSWHRAVILGKRGEALAGVLRTGTSVMIEGRLRTDSWEAQDGTKRYMTEVVVREIMLLPRGSDDQPARTEGRRGREFQSNGGLQPGSTQSASATAA